MKSLEGLKVLSEFVRMALIELTSSPDSRTNRSVYNRRVAAAALLAMARQYLSMASQCPNGVSEQLQGTIAADRFLGVTFSDTDALGAAEPYREVLLDLAATALQKACGLLDSKHHP